MNCPHCGAPVQDGLDVCPACHNAIVGPRDINKVPTIGEENTADDASSWCQSCGSAVPAGMDACPVCGMPVEGAYEETWGNEAKQPDVNPKKDEEPSPELSSAIPPAPEAGDIDPESEDAPTRLRLVAIAALAALIVVGGTALFITRPWDPDAYRTHAVEDADTSKEGFPGTVTHLEGQDLIEGSERRQYLADAEQAIDDFMALMGEVRITCADLEQPVDEYLSTGVLPEGTGRLATARDASERVATLYAKISELDLRGSDYEERQDSIVVTGGYLKGRIETLCMVWEALESQDDPADAIVAVRSAVNSGSEGRSLEEWRGLFENAYAGLEAQEE